MYLVKLKTEKNIDLTNNIDPNYRIVESIDTSIEDDASTVENWNLLIGRIKDDYIRMRDFAKGKFLADWANLDNSQKYSLLLRHVYPVNTPDQEIYSIISEEDFLSGWIDLAKKSKECRDNRWETARRKISFYLNESESLDMYNTTKNYSLEYKDANIPNLICWIKNSSVPSLGIDFTNNGFQQKSYYSSQLKDILVDIIEKGIY